MKNGKRLAFIIGFVALAILCSSAMINLDKGYLGWFALFIVLAIVDSIGLVINMEEYVEEN